MVEFWVKINNSMTVNAALPLQVQYGLSDRINKKAFFKIALEWEESLNIFIQNLTPHCISMP